MSGGPIGGWLESLAHLQADGAAITAAARTTMTNPQARRTLGANYWSYIGQQAILFATGRISCAVTTPGTARFDLSFGANVVFDTQAMNLNIVAKVNVHWMLAVLLTCRAVGSAANLMGQGIWTSEAVIASPLPTVGGSGLFTVPYNAAAAPGANFDSSASQVMDLFFTQTVATGSCTLHQLALLSVN